MCPQLEDHFRALIRQAALTMNIWGLDGVSCSVPDPYLCPQHRNYVKFHMQRSLILRTANFTLNKDVVLKSKCCRADSAARTLGRLAG